MFSITMLGKLSILLIATHYVLGFKENVMHMLRDHPHWKLVEKTYGTKPVPTDPNIDVGEPLILTRFIKSHKIKEAREASRVDDTFLLPGTESYAGYLTVKEEYNANLWFWYFPAQSKPVNESALILWLQGGPGASSLYGLFQEIGPFKTTDNLTIVGNRYSWGKNHSLLFIDNPVGTGFSFTDEAGYATNQTTIGEDLYIALQQFLTIFPELRTAPLFITGESFAGKHIPSIGIQIHRHRGQDQPINLQGLAIGNGFIDPITLLRYSYFFREVGLADDVRADLIKKFEITIAYQIENKYPVSAFVELGELLSTIDKTTRLVNIYNYLSDTEIQFESNKFVQTPQLRRALHVGNTTFSGPRKVYSHLISDFVNSVKPWLEVLLEHYRVLVYSGHLDCRVPYHASVNTYMSLKYSGAQKYKKAKRYPWYHNQTLAGYYKKGGNLLEVMVRGAGHMVPFDKPAEALGLISAFIQNISLKEDTGKLSN